MIPLVEMELSRNGAWPPESSDAHFVIEQTVLLQRDRGWDVVRPAVSSTIRCVLPINYTAVVLFAQEHSAHSLWIMKAVAGIGVANLPIPALKYWDRAIAVLTWGMDAWQGVSSNLRGGIFSGTFIVGLKSHRLETLLVVREQTRSPSSTSSLTAA